MRGRSRRLSGSMSAMSTPRKRYSAINCSTETCLRSNAATADDGRAAPSFARRAKASTIGAWATSRPLLAGSTLFDRNELPPRCAGVELARPADLVFGVADHLLPLGDPAHGSR